MFWYIWYLLREAVGEMVYVCFCGGKWSFGSYFYRNVLFVIVGFCGYVYMCSISFVLFFDDVLVCLFWLKILFKEERIMILEFIFFINVCDVGKIFRFFWFLVLLFVKWGSNVYFVRWFWGLEVIWIRYLFVIYLVCWE